MKARRARSAVALAALALALRSSTAGPGTPVDRDAAPAVAVRTVADVAAEDCITAAVRGLAVQIAATIRCERPRALVAFAEDERIRFVGSNVIPYLVPTAAAALARVPGPIEIKSGFRTIAEQALLARWAAAGQCGIAVAAQPGASNHEGGRALDLANSAQAATAMRARGWRRTVRGDQVHFEYTAARPLRRADVRAFQRLWNANHPGDRLRATGRYDAATARRLAAAPADGFPVDVCPAAAREAALLR